ncbi:MAG TPA: hypothetical protein VGM37_16225 [Armatimonadota bacterium]|jgi:hypothetical protein
MAKDNRYIQALSENENLIGIASAAALSVATLNPLPILVGAVAEAAYLLAVPDSKWYGARLSRRQRAAEDARRRQMWDSLVPALSNPMKERFAHLRSVRDSIAQQATPEADVFGEVLGKLDYLLDKFLLFASKEAQFRAYLGSMWLEASHDLPVADPPRPAPRTRTLRGIGDPLPQPPPPDMHVASIEDKIADIQGFYAGSIERMQALADHETDSDTKAVLAKRIDVLGQRREFAGRIGKILTNLTYQLGLLEDTFGLINDQMRARSPEQVLQDIDSVVCQTDSMTQLLDELGSYEQMTR